MWCYQLCKPKHYLVKFWLDGVYLKHTQPNVMRGFGQVPNTKTLKKYKQCSKST